MYFNELNEKQLEFIEDDITKNEYEWEEKHLSDQLLGFVIEERELYSYHSGRNLSEKEKQTNEQVTKINEIIRKYNASFKNNELVKEQLNQEYSLIDEEQQWYLNKDIIFSYLDFGKKILITGPGGIGKSQFVYNLYVESKDIKYNKLFLYGKYSEGINKPTLTKVLSEISKISKNEKFLFVIDAINEFDIDKRNIIYDFLNKEDLNMRVIITCRDFSIDNIELKSLLQLVDEQIPFSGVDIIDSIQKISEECNIDLTKYEELLYDNNPMHLNMIKNVISNNRLENKDCNSIVIGTDIYEQYIKNTTAKYDKDKKKYWNQTKDLVKYIVDNNIAFPTIDTVKNTLNVNATNYLYVMTREGFIDISNNMIIFRNETLQAYLIAREMFERLPQKEKDIINFINSELSVFHFIHEQVIVMLFDKIKTMKKIANIIQFTELKNYFSDVKFLNRIKFSKSGRKKFIKIFTYSGNIETALFSAGGFENNPLNCVNYLNKKMFAQKNTNFKICPTKIDIRYTKIHLVAWIRTIATFDCSDDYVEEKFWFALWCSSLVNKDIRYLSRKLIFEIVQKNAKYIDTLKRVYLLIEDEYIKEAIIQILCSQEKSNIKIKRFINKINNFELLNFQSLYYISNYLFNKEIYTSFNKHNLLKDTNSRNKVQEIYSFIKHALYIQKEEYDILGMEKYGDTIEYNDKFILEDKEKIKKVNNYIRKYWRCKTTCYYEDEFKDSILYPKFGKINEKNVKDYDIYYAWQEVLKQEFKKYGITYKDLEKSRVYDEDEKTIEYKALEIANNKIVGSISCNYYTTDFKIDGNIDDGYLQYRFEDYYGIMNLNSPITIFSEDIEKLNSKVIKSIEIPSVLEEINLEWANNKELSLKNFKNIITPIKYKGRNWILIYGSVKIKKENRHELKWSDEYIVNLAIDEDYTLKRLPEIDRKYTIETRHFNGNINDYARQNYTQSCSISKDSFWDKHFIESDFNFPPTQIIREFELTYNNKLSAWVDNDNNIIIFVSNNQDSWYRHGVTGSIFIDETYYNKLKEKYKLKYFAFTERFYHQYRDESSLQIEYIDDDNINYYLHYKANRADKNTCCEQCKVYKLSKQNEKKRRKNKFDDFLLRIIDDLDYDEDLIN